MKAFFLAPLIASTALIRGCAIIDPNSTKGAPFDESVTPVTLTSNIVIPQDKRPDAAVDFLDKTIRKDLEDSTYEQLKADREVESSCTPPSAQDPRGHWDCEVTVDGLTVKHGYTVSTKNYQFTKKHRHSEFHARSR